MTIEMDNPRLAGGLVVGALVDRTSDTSSGLCWDGYHCMGRGSKRPIAILVFDGEKTAIYSCDGDRLSRTRFDQVFQGQAARFETRARALLAG